jgi:Tetracyclin repressor-like, C-terminal domain
MHNAHERRDWRESQCRGDLTLTWKAKYWMQRRSYGGREGSFRDRDDILRALLQRIRLEVAAVLESVFSPEEGCERYLDYALSHAHEYELFFQKEYELFHSARSRRTGVKTVGRPGKDAMKRKLAAKFGASPEDYEQLQAALWMVAHGAAMLMIAKTIPPEKLVEGRAVFTRTVATLLREASRS